MPFIPVNLNEAKEPQPAPNGRYDVTISSVEQKLSKNGDPMLRVVSELPTDLNAPPIFTYVMLPDPSQDKEVLDRNMLGLKRFLKAFKVPIDSAGIDTDKLEMELPGYTANLEITNEVYQVTGAVSNQLKIPRIQDDGASAGRGSPPKARKA